MKLKSILASAVVCIMAASCAEKPIHNLDPNMMNGKYEGLTSTEMGASVSTPAMEDKVELTVTGENTLTAKIVYSEAEVVFENCTFERIAGGFSFAMAGEKEQIINAGMHGQEAKPVNHIFSAVSGKFVNGKIDFTYSVKPGKMPFAIKYVFAQVEADVLAIQGVKKLTVSMGVKEMSEPVEAEVEIFVHKNNEVSLSFPSVGKAPMAIAAFTWNRIQLSKTEGGFNFAFPTEFTKEYKNKVTNDETGKEEEVKKYVTFSKLTGSLVNGKLNIKYVAQPKGMPMSINFEYKTK